MSWFMYFIHICICNLVCILCWSLVSLVLTGRQVLSSYMRLLATAGQHSSESIGSKAIGRYRFPFFPSLPLSKSLEN